MRKPKITEVRVFQKEGKNYDPRYLQEALNHYKNLSLMILLLRKDFLVIIMNIMQI